VLLLRISLGIVYLWFGVLKFFPGLSPAAGLATRTIEMLTFGLIPAETALLLLAVWETLIGLGLIFGVWMRVTLLLLFVQMLGTLMPVFFFPGGIHCRALRPDAGRAVHHQEPGHYQRSDCARCDGARRENCG
jgi:uncharacterized membrane protein YphA (DoxX/SURF4 family)